MERNLSGCVPFVFVSSYCKRGYSLQESTMMGLSTELNEVSKTKWSSLVYVRPLLERQPNRSLTHEAISGVREHSKVGHQVTHCAINLGQPDFSFFAFAHRCTSKGYNQQPCNWYTCPQIRHLEKKKRTDTMIRFSAKDEKSAKCNKMKHYSFLKLTHANLARFHGTLWAEE